MRKMQSSKCPFNKQTLTPSLAITKVKHEVSGNLGHKINFRLPVMHVCKSSTEDLKQENCKFKTSLNDTTKIPASEELLYSIWNMNIKFTIS